MGRRDGAAWGGFLPPKDVLSFPSSGDEFLACTHLGNMALCPATETMGQFWGPEHQQPPQTISGTSVDPGEEQTGVTDISG